MSDDRIYFSLMVRNSPFSKDLDVFMQALQNMGDGEPVKAFAFSRVLPCNGGSEKTGIVFGEIENALTPQQWDYFNQFALVYDDRLSLEAAKAASFKIYCDHYPDPG